MTNVLKALKNIFKAPRQELISHYSGRNTINNVGEALEEYIKDAFAGTIDEKDSSAKNEIWNNVFSWCGNQNNPPDAIIRGGDAIEVKKIERYRADIALNSSYPKHKLYHDDPKLTTACRDSEVEAWEQKDIIYTIGTVKKKENKLTNLWFVYGDCYAASRETYERMINTIENGVTSIHGVEFSKTKELGKIDRVDPLGITTLRIRGMWQIKNPSVVFKDIYTPQKVNALQIACLMREEKYNSFNEEDKNKLLQDSNFTIEKERIKDPDNPASLLDAILITCICGRV